MKDVQKELASISTTLTSLAKQIEKMVATVEKESGKAAPKKKAKAAKKATAKKKAKAPAKKKTATKKRAAATKKTATKKKKKAVKKAVPAAKKEAPEAAAGATMLDNIFTMISRSRNGITVERLKKRTGLAARQVSNALYKLSKKGKIETISRGVYTKKKK